MIPSLPRWLFIQKDESKQDLQDWNMYPWHPDLSWIPSYSNLRKSTYEILVQLNKFFINRGLQKFQRFEYIPIKERSLEIFGDGKEKLLNNLVKQKWFKENLTLEHLGCYKTIEPFVAKTACCAKTHHTIILENMDTFDSFWRSNEQLPTPPYRHIIYGNGNDIESKILWITQFDPQITTIEYFGDLDLNGVQIPYRISNILREHGCSHNIKMALPFYLRLIELFREEHPHLVPSEKKISSEKIEKVLDFLPLKEQLCVGYLFMNRKGIAQELLDRKEILKLLNSLLSH